jgi:hypothetical protein
LYKSFLEEEDEAAVAGGIDPVFYIAPSDVLDVVAASIHDSKTKARVTYV